MKIWLNNTKIPKTKKYTDTPLHGVIDKGLKDIRFIQTCTMNIENYVVKTNYF